MKEAPTQHSQPDPAVELGPVQRPVPEDDHDHDDVLDDVLDVPGWQLLHVGGGGPALSRVVTCKNYL